MLRVVAPLHWLVERTAKMRQEITMRRALLASLLLLPACHESELEPATPDRMWEDPSAFHSSSWEPMTTGPLEATYALAPVPAVVNPAPLPPEPPRSISLGFIGDEPLTATPPHPARWPYVPEGFYPPGYPGLYGRRAHVLRRAW
jgi:hypothetical protein